MPLPATRLEDLPTEADLGDLDVDTLLYVVLDPAATALARKVALATLVAYMGTDFVPLAQRGAANGVATLDAGGLIPGAQLPPLALGETFTVASQAAMLALVAQRGDMAIRTDLDPDGFFLLTTDSPGTLADWKQILAPGSVVSVDTLTGAVDLSGRYVALPAVGPTSAAQILGLSDDDPLTTDWIDPPTPAVVAGQTIGLKVYNPGSVAQYSVTSSFADLDATNLAVTFTVPPSGAVLVKGLITSVVGANGTAVNLREGSSNIAGTEQVVNDQQGTSIYLRAPFAMYLSGLTPGAVKTYKLGGVGNTNITNAFRVGGTGTTQTSGPAVIEVVAAP